MFSQQAWSWPMSLLHCRRAVSNRVRLTGAAISVHICDIRSDSCNMPCRRHADEMDLERPNVQPIAGLIVSAIVRGWLRFALSAKNASGVIDTDLLQAPHRSLSSRAWHTAMCSTPACFGPSVMLNTMRCSSLDIRDTTCEDAGAHATKRPSRNLPGRDCLDEENAHQHEPSRNGKPGGGLLLSALVLTTWMLSTADTIG